VHGSSVNMMKELGIFYIVNATKEDYSSKYPSLEFKFLLCQIEDHPKQNIAQFFDPVCSFAEEAWKNSDKLLIHCGQGISRSCSLVLAVLVKTKGWTLKKSFLYLISKHPTANPNNGFMKQLIEFEKRILGSTSLVESDFEDDWGWGCYELLKK